MIPTVVTAQDVIAQLLGKKIFTVIDMSSGFWQVQLDKENSYLCCFNTCFGPYKFLRMPFGINSGPEVFQKYVNSVFGGIKGVHIIFDDLIIAATSSGGSRIIPRGEFYYILLANLETKIIMGTVYIYIL